MKDTNTLRYMIYKRSENKVASIFTDELPETMSCLPAVALVNEKAYYFDLNVAEKTMIMREFNLQNSQVRTIYTFPAANINDPFQCITVEKERINVILRTEKNEAKLVSFHPEVLEEKHIINLPSGIDTVYTVSYDTVSKAYAIGYYSNYYSTEDKEYLAILTPDPAQLDVELCISDTGVCGSNFFFNDSHIYFVCKKKQTSFFDRFSDSTGYALIDYNYKNATFCEATDFTSCFANEGILYGMKTGDPAKENSSLWKVL